MMEHSSLLYPRQLPTIMEESPRRLPMPHHCQPRRGDWIQQRGDGRWKSSVETVFYTHHHGHRPTGERVEDLGIVQGQGLYMGPVHAVHYGQEFIAVQVPHPNRWFELVWTNVYAFQSRVDYHFVVPKSVLDGWYQKGWVNEFLDEQLRQSVP